MLKKFLVCLTASVVVLSMNAGVFASNTASIENVSEETMELGAPSDEQETELKDASTAELTEIEISFEGTPNIADLSVDAINVTSADIITTGEMINIPRTRTANAISNSYGSLSGILTSSNTFDYYIFSSANDFFSLSQVVTSNPNYTMTLGIVDYTINQILLTNYVFAANNRVEANIPKGDYAWVIQSNGTYGNDYKLQYNMSLSTTDTPLYVTSDLQKLFSVSGQKLRVNNQIQNIDYTYDRDVEYPQTSFWNKLHISMKNANISVAHIGGVRYYAGSNLYDYPNAILLRIQEGGTFYHSFWQNPPHVHYVDEDMYGNLTPRSIDYYDMEDRGAHYLIYNINTSRVEEMVSGLVQPWSPYGDRSRFSIYETN